MGLRRYSAVLKLRIVGISKTIKLCIVTQNGENIIGMIGNFINRKENVQNIIIPVMKQHFLIKIKKVGYGDSLYILIFIFLGGVKLSTGKIDNINLFKDALKNGVNLFVGAGFSVLPTPDGDVLPDAKSLAKEICEKFDVEFDYKDDLEMLANVVDHKDKQGFQEFLREKYTVDSYDSLYDALNLINIRSYITTNIDNQIHCIMRNSKTYYLHDIKLNGATRNGLNKIPYIALHGNVTDVNANLYFGKDELSEVGEDNRDLFEYAYTMLYDGPTIFLGYGFHDAAVYNKIVKITKKKKNDIWVQCRPDSNRIDYFRELGYFTLAMDTKDFLKWVLDEFQSYNKTKNCSPMSGLHNYLIPKADACTAILREDYFRNGKTQWYCIFNDYPYHTHYFNELREKILGNKNVIFYGIPFSGKTTLLMQCAIAFSKDYDVIYLDNCLDVQAQSILKRLNGKEVMVFIDNCCDDAGALQIFFDAENVNVIGCCDDYSYESSKHLLSDCYAEPIDISEISIKEAQIIYSHIKKNKNITTDQFINPVENKKIDKVSLFEILNKNVKHIISYSQVSQTLKRIKEDSERNFEILALTTYLVQNESMLNTDVLFAYFDDAEYETLRQWIAALNNYLSELNVTLDADECDQDYYVLRSRIFLHYVHDVLRKEYPAWYGKVIRHFTFNVHPYRIYNYKTFRRRAYDAELFYHIFKNTAHDLYEHIYAYDENVYTLQQFALYKMRLGEYNSAFSDIDLAINKSKNNFSMKNTRAIILFEANKDKGDDDAKKSLHLAMDILRQCHDNDKRKLYHAQKYAEFALYFANNYGFYDYLDVAKKWLQEFANKNSRYGIRKLIHEVDVALSNSAL